jgi:arylsulfatase
MRIIKIILLSLIILDFGFSALAQQGVKSSKSTRPNVILILTDDMGYGDLGCYGGFPYHTPNINRLANQGMRFTSFYVSQAVCSASRSSFLTSCYHNRIGISGALSPDAGIALNPEEETIAKLLKKSGYKTGMIGKWHLGSKVPYLPLNYGFDEFIGLPYSHDYWPVNYDGKPADTTTKRGKWPVLKLIEGNERIVHYPCHSCSTFLSGRFQDSRYDVSSASVLH